MNEFSYDPPLPAATISPPFIQVIRLTDSGILLGSAQWFGGSDGVVQILDLHVVRDQQRIGLGENLLHAIVDQAKAYYRLRQSPLRRMWMLVEQKSQVNGRAFLTSHGFHHIATVGNLLKQQDALVYVKAFT